MHSNIFQNPFLKKYNVGKYLLKIIPVKLKVTFLKFTQISIIKILMLNNCDKCI